MIDSRPLVPSGEAGHTVLEVAVALALLVAVLVPAVGTLVSVVLHDGVDERTVALGLCQGAMERTLRDRRFDDARWTRRDGRWMTARAVAVRGRRVDVTVRVWRLRAAIRDGSHDAEPLVELSTTRLLLDDARSGSPPHTPFAPSQQLP